MVVGAGVVEGFEDGWGAEVAVAVVAVFAPVVEGVNG